jgi:3-oxoacyl-[acyl-carrier protein] reductase
VFESLKNKKVLITGATGGIGAAMANLFAEYGACLGLHYGSNSEGAKKLLEEVRSKTREAEILQADLLDSASRKELIPAFIKRFGGIDVLINNAGAAHDYKHFSELSEKSWQDTFDLNVKAPFYLMSDVFPHMEKQGSGRVINISSANVKYGGSAKSLHYVAAKAALDSLTLGFSKEGASHNILVNSIRCGVIDTPMRMKVSGYNEESFKNRIKLIPLKRVGQPMDIARMALFLAAETGNFITGEIFTVAGGD